MNAIRRCAAYGCPIFGASRYGWCEACCTRWYRAGKPETGPPARKGKWTQRPTECRECALPLRKATDHGGNGWCRACHMRWWRAGKPETGPPAYKRDLAVTAR